MGLYQDNTLAESVIGNFQENANIASVYKRRSKSLLFEGIECLRVVNICCLLGSACYCHREPFYQTKEHVLVTVLVLIFVIFLENQNIPLSGLTVLKH